MILKREPGDWDITTSARPEQVKALFTRTTGYRHTAWHCDIMVGKEGYEVTTFRVDGDIQMADTRIRYFYPLLLKKI